MAKPKVTSEDEAADKGGDRENQHLLQAGHLAILACKHDAAQLATHIVLCLDKPPTIHFAIAKLNCRRIGNTKDNCVETNSSC